MDPVAFQMGPFPIRWYGIFISSAIAAAAVAAYRETEYQGLDPEHILNIAVLTVPAAIIGARLYYVFFSGNLQDYLQNPVEILATWHGGLAIHGGLIAGILAGYFYVRKYKLKFWRMADIIAPGIVLGQAIGRWGNFFNQEAHGGPVSYEFISRFPGFIQKGMFIKGQYYQPTFLYESLWDLGVFLFLILIRRREWIARGDIFLAYGVLYSAGRFFIEGLRTDSLMLGPFRVAQVISLGIMVTASLLLAWNHRLISPPSFDKKR